MAMGKLGIKSQPGRSYGHLMNAPTVTSPHSGHFMTSNLDDDDDTVDGLGRGLGIEGPDPSTAGIVFGHSAQQKGYNFEDACKKPRDTYRFISNNKHYVRDFDNSLNKMFACMSLAYSGQLSTPKFKAFKGMKINVWDKMRLNNIIWREWHLQFVKRHKPLVCSFTIHMDVHTKPQAVVLEGKYWKRKLDIVCVEYQKWRVFYRKKIMPKNNERLGIVEPCQIEELLERVAGHGTHDKFCSQTRDSFHIDDDQFAMDFSDTLFSTLTQNSNLSASGRDDYYGGLANPDFIQPHLIGLQPSIDDLSNSEGMEPFQDLLNEAFGWSSSVQSQMQNVSPYLAAESVQQPFQPNYSSTYSSQPTFTAFSQPAPTVYTPQVQARQPITNVGGPPVTTVPNTKFPPLLYTPDLAVPTLSYLTVVQPSDVRQQTALLPTIPVKSLVSTVSKSSTSKEYFHKPRPIAPKATKGRRAMPSPFLTQLLRSHPGVSNVDLFTPMQESALRGNSSSHKTIVPDLVAVSGTSTAGSNTSQASLAQFPAPRPSGEMTGDGVRLPANEASHPASERHAESSHGHFISSSAEQKRRSHIKNGFDAIQTLVPALVNNPSNKFSKAMMLIKTAEFAQKLKTERQQMQNEANMLQQEIDALNSAICDCQSQLPATGVPLAGQHNSQMKEVLQAYIAERTSQNWKFYIFSQLASPLFDSFSTMVSTASVDELYRTTQTWLDQHCTLPALRPAILSSLRTIGTNTSILSDPSALPEQARAAVHNMNSKRKEDSTAHTDPQYSAFLSETDPLPS